MPDDEYHRYGRHGPHAWLRWRNRRWHRPLPIPSPETRIVVIYVHVPVVLPEKMVIIVNPAKQLKEVEGSVEAIESDGFDNIRENMCEFGTQHGQDQAELDMRSLTPRILIGEALQERAGNDFKKLVPLANIGTFSRKEACAIYEKAYCAAYRSTVAPIEDEMTRAVWVLAIQNRKRAKPQELMLYVAGQDNSDLQTTLRIIQLLGLRDPEDSAYLEEIKRLKEVYDTLSARVESLGKEGGDAASPPNPFQGSSYGY